ncbi:MAG TPA: MOSC domain-containing protein [Pirellulales bacterium]|nr:MOSC domain-containing protein [Pirellulales bacterium]
MFEGTLEAIFIGSMKAGPMQPVESAQAIAAKGLQGDRYSAGSGTFSDWPDTAADPTTIDPETQITLIEAEALEAVARDCEVTIAPAQSRRNLLVRGVPLNHLVGREFLVGPVRLRGIKLCEPCGHLEKLTVPGIRQALLHRGGLRAEILTSGTLQAGDVVRQG